jgi:hypothetical protein
MGLFDCIRTYPQRYVNILKWRNCPTDGFDVFLSISGPAAARAWVLRDDYIIQRCCDFAVKYSVRSALHRLFGREYVSWAVSQDLVNMMSFVSERSCYILKMHGMAAVKGF